jgi:hypothetical protein
MSRTKFLLALTAFGFLTFAVTLRVAAIPAIGQSCQSSGGCSSPCTNSGSGSTVEMSASGSSQCATSYGGGCKGSGLALCGEVYVYSGPNCDGGVIIDSYPVFSGYC